MKLEQEDIIRQLTLIGYSEEQVEWFLKMRKLIPVEEDKTVNGRKLHEVLKVGRDYSTWIKQQFKSLDLIEGKHFTTRTPLKGSDTQQHGGQNKIDYILKGILQEIY